MKMHFHCQFVMYISSLIETPCQLYAFVTRFKYTLRDFCSMFMHLRAHICKWSFSKYDRWFLIMMVPAFNILSVKLSVLFFPVSMRPQGPKVMHISVEINQFAFLHFLEVKILTLWVGKNII